MSNSTRLRGRIALITGSTSGIGFAIAERLAEDGARIIISSRKQENVDGALKKLAEKGHDVCGVACNISNVDDRKKLVLQVERIGGLDIFVQCAGANLFNGHILDCPEDRWDKTMDINLKSTWLLTKDLLPFLKNSKCGRVIYNSSASVHAPLEILGVYPVSKAALHLLTKTVALQLGRLNITVNCLVPGLIETPFSEVLVKDEEAKSVWNSLVCIKRYGKPADVAGITAFLASDEASFISGECIVIAGGFPSSRL
ncbi:unnamed protein product [Phyllotreta striolata]|uniref:Dehydrogenase/reductase SDR family member 4 n=1 Tax=Phyllotreta striolata TaxID=444603 RepID=A0A9N9TPZ6_PHYSR|nr:unnamed protein product [Phyllotreta striolata]